MHQTDESSLALWHLRDPALIILITWKCRMVAKPQHDLYCSLFCLSMTQQPPSYTLHIATKNSGGVAQYRGNLMGSGIEGVG